MDIADIAQRHNEIFEDAALQAHFLCNQPLGLNHNQGTRNKHMSPDCEDCGKPIPPERLAVNPAATRCVQCQTKIERRRTHEP